MWRAAFRALNTDVVVEADETGVDLATLRALTATYAPASGDGGGGQRRAALRFCIHSDGRVVRDGEQILPAGRPIDAAPAFEADLYRQLLLRLDEGWPLHAAALCGGAGEGVAVLAGPQGSGKSTLSAALVRRGLRYLADDATVICRGRARGITRPISFSSGLPAQPACQGLAVVEYPLRVAGAARAHRLLLPPAECLERGEPPVRVLVALQLDPAGRPGPVRLTPGEALSRLWPNTLGGGAAAWREALGAVGSIPAFLLVTREVEAACDDVLALLERDSGGQAR